MMKKVGLFLLSLLLAFCANCYVLFRYFDAWRFLFLIIPAFLLLNALPVLCAPRILTGRLKMSFHGVLLLKAFVISLVLTVVFQLTLACFLFPENWKMWLWSVLWCTVAEAIVFWNGMISVYVFSYQLGIHRRLVGALCGLVPILNIVQLRKIIHTVSDEVNFETEKIKVNLARKNDALCKTKYPILLVHGVFFRDFRFFNYWGRIPAELAQNGASIYYGEHESAVSVEEAAKELSEKIKKIVSETGCEKVNIIAHSKGGLDSRYAIANLGVAPYVASLTTVNTPHKGCEFADKLLSAIPEDIQEKVAEGYNKTMRKLGDKNPDFIAAVSDLTASACEKRNEALSEHPNLDGIFVQSIGSRLDKAVNGKFPLNLTYHLVKFFDGPNDGLVSEKSFPFGEHYRLLTANGERGISHGDMIDLNRENIDGFDVREFYVELVSDLKKRGL